MSTEPSPFISILTPSYNYRRFLPECLASVSCNGFPHYEHIVIDDASTDGSAHYLETRSDTPRLCVVTRSENMGLGATLNEALGYANGHWIGWLNSDDFYLPGAFTALHRAVQSNPRATVIFGDTLFVDQRSRVLRILAQHSFSQFTLRHYGTFLAPPSTFVRADALREVGGWRDELRLLVDWDLWLRLSDADDAHIVYIPHLFGAYRRHPGQLSLQGLPSFDDERQHVRQAFGVPTTGASRVLMRTLGRTLHIAGKVGSLAYKRQYYGRTRARMSSVSWMNIPTLTQTLANLTAEYPGLRDVSHP